MSHLHRVHFSFQPRRNHSLASATVLVLLALLIALLGTAPAAANSNGPGNGFGYTPPWADGDGFDLNQDPAIQYFAQIGLLDFLNTGDTSGLDLDEYHTIDHIIPLGDGRHIHALETFNLRAWLRIWPRAVMLLNGSAFVANHWTMPAEGYHGAQILAGESYYVFSVDYLGTGQSTRPDHGRDAEYEVNREAMKTVLRYIRYFRGVHRVDIIGDGYGGAMATELAEDRHRVRSIAMSAMIYEEVQGGPLDDPAFVTALASIPNGYVLLPGFSSLQFMNGAPQSARDYVVVTQGGFYPVDNFLAAADRPFFDPSKGKAPALILYGGRDFIAVRSDVQKLADDYGQQGARAHLVIKEDAGHAPRAGSPTEAAWYWDNVLDFIRNPWAGN